MTDLRPDGWPAGMHPRPEDWPAPTRRFTEQRWSIDAAISQIGIDWDQGRTRYIGGAGGGAGAADFARAHDAIAKLADVERVFGAAATKREAAAQVAWERTIAFFNQHVSD